MAAIAVVVNGGGSGIEPTAPIAASLMVAVVDGVSDDGVFTNASHDDDRHPRPHHHCPFPPADKDWTAGWRAHRGMSCLSLPRLLSLAPWLSPLMGRRRQGRWPQQQTRPSRRYPRLGRGGRDTTTPSTWSNKNKNKNKNNNSGGNVTASAPADSYARAAAATASA
jgi:hypothetical protein